MKLASVTNSERLTAACPQRWLLRYGLGLRGQDSSPALYIGSLVHTAIEQLSKCGSAKLWTRHASNMAINVAAEDWRKKTESERNMMLSNDELDSATECEESAKRIMEGYIRHWREKLPDWQVVLNEYAFDFRLRDSNGKKLPAGCAGKIDRVVLINGEYWLVETKTTSVAISEWVERNRRNPQAASYAIALAASKGIEVQGVIYDLVNSKPGRSAESLAVIKDGTRLVKPSGLPYCTARQFEIAISKLHNGSLYDALASVDWYRPTLAALELRDESGFWFHHEVLRFTNRELHRVQSEMETAVRRIAKWRKYVNMTKRAYANSGTSESDALLATMQTLSSMFPREPSMCFQYNRLCSLAAICSSHHEDDLRPYTVSRAPGGHDELYSAEIDSALDQ